MTDPTLENFETKELVRTLRRESLDLNPKPRKEIPEENEDEVISVTHHFSRIISHLLSLIKSSPKKEVAKSKRWTNTKIILRNVLMHWKSIIVVTVPLILLPLLIVSGTKEARCAYVVLMMALYWMTEVLPLPVTSLLPIALFPPFGILSTEDVCAAYFREVTIMLFGGLALAIAIEYCHLHERIALKVLLIVGTSPRALMLGFMLLTMFLSMWISNTAATAMTAPIAAAVLREIQQDDKTESSNKPQRNPSADQSEPVKEEEPSSTENASSKDNPEEEETKDLKEDVTIPINNSVQEREKSKTSEMLTTGYFLSLSFSSNIGGTGTLIGTGTNLTFAGIFESLFPRAKSINFATWMFLAVPSMLINTFLGWVWLQIYFLRLFRGGINTGGPEASKKVRILIENKYKSLGPMSQHEYSVLILFIIIIILWLFRSPQFITGWGDIISSKAVKDSSPAIVILVLMFILPADLKFLSCKGRHGVSPSLLVWSAIHEKLPWGLLLLLGGGFAMAKGCVASGLSKWVGVKLVVLKSLPAVFLLFIICFLACCLTQVTSNTSAVNIFLPVLSEMSKAIHKNPLFLMIPTTLSCSYAFMLPVGTPPNAIVQAYADMNTTYMMKAGAVMSIICVVVSIIVFNTIGMLLFDVEGFPDWAEDIAQNKSSAVI